MYGVVLFAHVCALLAAMSAGAVSHLSEARMRSAETTAALRPWARLLGRTAKVFPVALLILLVSGAYLVHDAWSWSAGWVDASLVGVGLLFASGAGVVRVRGVALRRALMAAGDGPPPPEVRRLIVEHPAAFASWMNTGHRSRDRVRDDSESSARRLGRGARRRSCSRARGCDWRREVCMPSAVVFGARNLGAAIARGLLADGYRVASVARTASDLEALEADGAVAVRADVSEPAGVGRRLLAPRVRLVLRTSP